MQCSFSYQRQSDVVVALLAEDSWTIRLTAKLKASFGAQLEPDWLRPACPATPPARQNQPCEHLLLAEDTQQANLEFAKLSRTAKDLQESAQLYQAQVCYFTCTVASVGGLWYVIVLVSNIAQHHQLHCFTSAQELALSQKQCFKHMHYSKFVPPA